MRSKQLNKGKITASTQKYLDIAEIKNDTVVLKDGTLRSVLMVSSVNFALKSNDEQVAIIQAYVSFLNSFDFPLQIMIQSRPLNIDGYLAKLIQREKELDNDLLKRQIKVYRSYIERLVKNGRIMSKRFYIVVPYTTGPMKQKGLLDKLSNIISPSSSIALSQKKFDERHKLLFQRVNHIVSGLSSMGIKADVIDTEGLIELYYNSYNLDLSSTEVLTDTAEIQLEE